MSSDSSGNPQFGGRHRLLLRVERFGRRHYLIVFVMAALALAAGGFFGSKLKLESNVLALIPEGNRQVDTLKEALNDFGSIDYLMVLLEAADDNSQDSLEDFSDVLAERLSAETELIEYVEHRFALDESFLELFYDNALLFLPPEKLADVAAKLEDEAIRRQVQETRLHLSNPAAILLDDPQRADPLGLMPLFLDRLQSNRNVLQIDVSDGYYLSRDRKLLIMLVKPTGPSQDIDFDERLLQAVRQAETDSRDEIHERDGADALTPSVHYGGNYAVAVDEADLIREDVSRNLILSLLAVSMLYWLCYRRFAALLYSSVPLLVGQALTFGLAFLVLQSLNASSSAFTALLMGLGTDFVIVIYARYVEERRAGRTLAQATERMIGETGLGVFTGAITSAGTFYAMCISQFRGLRDLGFLIGSGILLCAVAILFMLPAMITWNEGVRKRKVDSVKKLHLQSFLLEHLIPLSVRYRKTVITLIVIATLGSGWLATRLEFDDSIKALRSNKSAAYQVQKRITDRFGAALSYMMAIVEAPTHDEALALTQKVEDRLQPFVEDGTVGSYDSVLAYLPGETQQREVLQAVAASPAEFDAERVKSTFLSELDKQRMNPAAFDEFLGRLDRFLGPEQPLRLQDLENRGLDRLLGRYVRSDEGRVRIVTYVFLADARWKRQPPPGFVNALTGDDARIVITGTNVVSKEFRRIFSREAPRAVALGLVVVFVLLWIDFRSLRLTSIALAQLVCGVIMMLGMMRVLDVPLNYVNAFVATMILGVGIDYSIHIVHRFTLSDGLVEEGLLETGKAVVMAALTNIAGFGTLWFGNYPALRSFGQVALIGSLTCLLTALTLVPAIMGRQQKG